MLRSQARIQAGLLEKNKLPALESRSAGSLNVGFPACREKSFRDKNLAGELV
jgi:hypothetical protein